MQQTSPRSTATRTFDTSLGKVHARVIGHGPTALLWHGMFVDGRSWDRVIPRLSAHRRLIVLDGPGYGLSDELTRLSTIEECAEVAAQIIAQVPDAETVDWVGNAWGGHVGMTTASLFPQLFRSLVAIGSPVQPIDDAFRRHLIVAGVALARFGPIGRLRHAVYDSQLTTAHQRDRTMTDLIDHAVTAVSSKALARTMTSFIINRTDAAHRLPRIQAPTLLMTGDDRGEWPPDAMVAAATSIPDARTLVIPDSRTLLQVEQPEPTADAIVAHWESVAAG